MTDPTPAPRKGGRPEPRSRQAIGIWIGAGLGVLVIGAVLLLTLVSGGDSDSSGGTTTAVAQQDNPVAPTGIVVTGTVVTPPGDYTAYCQRLAELDAGAGFSKIVTPQQMVEASNKVDFGALEEVAPPAFVPTLETLDATREQVVALFEQLDDFSELTNADFPAGFLDAARVFTQTYEDECV